MLGKNIGGKIMTYGKAGCLKVKLFSEAGTGYFYTWKKNPKAYPWRIGALSEFTVKLCSNQCDICHQPNWQSKAALSRTGHTPSQPMRAPVVTNYHSRTPPRHHTLRISLLSSFFFKSPRAMFCSFQ